MELTQLQWNPLQLKPVSIMKRFMFGLCRRVFHSLHSVGRYKCCFGVLPSAEWWGREMTEWQVWCRVTYWLCSAARRKMPTGVCVWMSVCSCVCLLPLKTKFPPMCRYVKQVEMCDKPFVWVCGMCEDYASPYAEALSFNMSRHKWQLQLPVETKTHTHRGLKSLFPLFFFHI